MPADVLPLRTGLRDLLDGRVDAARERTRRERIAEVEGGAAAWERRQASRELQLYGADDDDLDEDPPSR